MSQDAQLFKVPSIESHLVSSTAVEIDKALEILNEEGGFPTDPAALAELRDRLVERFSVRQVPAIDEGHLQFHNERNHLLTLLIPILGNIYFLTYQVRNLPAPALVGQLHVEGEAGTIALVYKLKEPGRGWEASLDGDLALLKTYIGATAAAIATYNATLPGVIEGKIAQTLAQNQLRREIAAKLAKRGFREAADEPLPQEPG